MFKEKRGHTNPFRNTNQQVDECVDTKRQISVRDTDATCNMVFNQLSASPYQWNDFQMVYCTAYTE